MKNNWFSKGSKLYPLIGLIALSVMQYFYTQSNLQSFRSRADQDYETLRERMNEGNIPPNIKEHIIYVQNQSALNAELLFNSSAFMQIFVQFNILLLFWSFFSTKNDKPNGEEQSE